MNLFDLRLASSVTLALYATVAQAAPPYTLKLETGQQKTWTQSRVVNRAATADPEIVGINVVPPRGVILTAKKPGTAMVSVWEEGGAGTPATQLQVVVTPSGLATTQSLGKDKALQADTSGTKLRLSGELSSLDKHAALDMALARGDDKPNHDVIDNTTSGFDVQVQIDVKIVEVSRKKLKESGFYHQRFHYNADGSFGGATGLSGPGVYGGFTAQNGTYTFQSSSGFVPFTDAFNIFSVSNNAWAAFSALEQNGFAYALAEPSLTALSGQTATFLAGGEIPIPFRSGTDGAVSVEFKKFGISLALTPTVHDNKMITLKVAPEVSEPDPSLSVSSGGYTIPGLRVRRTDTTVVIGDGETFVISGLVSRNTSSSIDKFPFLGDIPILGAFFRSNRFDREDKELLMIARPHLVRPFAKNAKLPALPGEDVRNYDPGFFHMLLQDTSEFKSAGTGFSQ